MLCCIRRTKAAVKNEEADQEIKQDGIKPEEKAHKAATKIQASFRGHITRRKMKDGEENGAVPEESAETTEGEEEKERISPSEEKPAEVSTETAEENKPVKSPNSPAAEAPPTADHAPSGTPSKEEVQVQPQEVEKPKEAEKPAEEPAVNAQNEEEEEAKRADVPDDAESHETDKREDVDDSKPADEAVSDAGKEENI